MKMPHDDLQKKHFGIHTNEQRKDLNKNMPGTSFKGKIMGNKGASTKRHPTTKTRSRPL